MLKLSKNDGRPIAKFETWYELYQYIRDLENEKLLEGHSQFGQTNWSFMVLSPERVIELYGILKKEYKLEILSRALAEGAGIIEMQEGKELRLIVASPRADIEGWRQEFCDNYCHAHKLVIKECRKMQP